MTEGIIKLLLLFIAPLGGHLSFCAAQPPEPVKWSFQSKYITGQQATLTFTAQVLPGWHVYSQFMEEGGPFPTRFSFESNGAYVLVGKVLETGKGVKFYDDNLMMDIWWYSDTVTFSQKITLRQNPVTVRGKVEFMACNEHICLPVDERSFYIEVSPWKKGP